MVLLAVGLVFLGATVLLFAFNDPSAESSRSQLAVFTAMTVVALPVWGVRFWVARRFAMRDPLARASALRRLYLYFVCLATALAAMETLAFALFFLFQPVFDQLPLNGLTAAQLGWASVVCVALLGFHFVIASRDRAAVGEEGASATLRRWYMYVALLVGLLTMLSSAAYLLQLGWTKLVLGSIVQYLYMATPAGSVIAGALLWSFHARAVATNHISDDRHSTLRDGLRRGGTAGNSSGRGRSARHRHQSTRLEGSGQPLADPAVGRRRGLAGPLEAGALGRGPAVAQPQALCLGRSSRQCAGGPWRRRRAHQRPASAGLQRASEPDR